MPKMNRLFLLLALLSSLVLAVSGCARKEIQNFYSPMPATVKASDMDIEKAIIRAGARTNWDIRPTGNRTLVGTLNVRSHQAVVTITYDDKRFQIQYKDSTNLKYDNGTIHKRYNSWVATLDKNIKQELLELTR